MRQWMRGLPANLALAGITTLCCLAAAEGVLRARAAWGGGGKERFEEKQYVVHDPVLGWRKRPGAHVVYHRRDYTAEFDVNPQGLRGPGRDPQAPAGPRRLLALGDSFVEAYMVPDGQMVTSRLESWLGDRACASEVINGGTTAYSTDQEYLYYRDEGRAYGAQVVLLFVYHNDIPLLVSERQGPYPKPRLDFAAGIPHVANAPVPTPARAAAAPATDEGADAHSYLLEAVQASLANSSARTYNRLAEIGLWAPLRRRPPTEELLLYHVPELGHQRPMWSQFTWTLQALDALVRAHSGRLVVAYVPARFEIEDTSWERTLARSQLEPSGLDRAAVARRVERISGRLGLPFIDLTQAMREASGPWTPVYYPTDNHWNARGQDAAARALAAFLTASHLLPGCG